MSRNQVPLEEKRHDTESMAAACEKRARREVGLSNSTMSKAISTIGDIAAFVLVKGHSAAKVSHYGGHFTRHSFFILQNGSHNIHHKASRRDWARYPSHQMGRLLARGSRCAASDLQCDFLECRGCACLHSDCFVHLESFACFKGREFPGLEIASNL